MFVFYYERSLLHIKCTHTHKQILCQTLKLLTKSLVNNYIKNK